MEPQFNQLGASWHYNYNAGVIPHNKGAVPMVAAYDYCGGDKQYGCSQGAKNETAFNNFLAHIKKETDPKPIGFSYKGGYWLVGNEPDLTGPDNDGFCYRDKEKIICNWEEAAYVYGTLMREVLKKDNSAKFIIFGLSSPNTSYADAFITAWDKQWGE